MFLERLGNFAKVADGVAAVRWPFCAGSVRKADSSRRVSTRGGVFHDIGVQSDGSTDPKDPCTPISTSPALCAARRCPPTSLSARHVEHGASSLVPKRRARRSTPRHTTSREIRGLTLPRSVVLNASRWQWSMGPALGASGHGGGSGCSNIGSFPTTVVLRWPSGWRLEWR